MTQHSQQAKSTFLNFFEYYFDEKENEILQTNIKNCYNTNSSNAITTPKTSQAHISQLLLAKKKTKYFFPILTPLASFKSLLVNNLDIGLTLRLNDDYSLFTTSESNIKPTLKVDEIRLVCQFVLLKETLVNRIESSLARRNIQISFMQFVQKKFAINQGLLETSIDVSLRDNFTDLIFVFFQSDACELGSFETNAQLMSTHGISHSYLEGAVGVKIPVLPCAELSDIPGKSSVDEKIPFFSGNGADRRRYPVEIRRKKFYPSVCRSRALKAF